MTETNPPPPRRKFWPVAVVVVALLALTTWDALRSIGGSHGEALRRAAFNGDEAAVRRIVAAHPECIDSVNRSAAVLQGLREGAARFGVSRPAPEQWSKDAGFEFFETISPTALFLAVQRTNLTVAKFLVDSGANVNVFPKGNPLSFTAMLVTRDTNFLAMLVKHGAKINVQDPVALYTLFHLAAHYPQKPEMHQFLLESGVPINARSHDGSTALFLAVSWDRPVLVQFLLENGADWTMADRLGRTPLIPSPYDNRCIMLVKAKAAVHARGWQENE
ncbi:MAG: ankyrin repeat domain-containing protein, partial [Limisphaerales bacterium]